MMVKSAMAGLMCALSLAASPGLDALKADPDPQRRYRGALDYSVQQINAARKAYEENRAADFEASLIEVAAGATLCDETLRTPGRNSARNAGHFKRAEIKLREILRRLDQLEKEVAVEDRAAVLKTRNTVREIHDRLLLDITGRRRLK